MEPPYPLFSEPSSSANLECESNGHSRVTQQGAIAPMDTRCLGPLPPLRPLLPRCTFHRRRAAAARGRPPTPISPPRSRCMAFTAGPPKRFAGTASCSALKSNQSRCFLWMQGSMVMLLSMLATPYARSQRLAEIRKDSPQLPARCKKMWMCAKHSRRTALARLLGPSLWSVLCAQRCMSV